MVLGMEATPLHGAPQGFKFQRSCSTFRVALFSPTSGFRYHHHQVHFSSLRRGGKEVENKVYSEISDLLPLLTFHWQNYGHTSCKGGWEM